MSEFSDLKEEISMWSADDIVDAVEAVKKARSKDAVTNALSELQAKLEEQRDAIEEELNNERERVEALETAQQSIEDLLSNVENALSTMEQ